MNKTLNSGSTYTIGENEIDFIKNKKRFPINKKTAFPLIAGIISIAFLIYFLLLVILLSNTKSREMELNEIILLSIVVILCTTPYVFGIYKIVQNFLFKEIKTNFSIDQNRSQLIAFLKSKSIAFHHNIVSHDLVQITSSNIGDIKTDIRQVVIFVVDNQRILINSHVLKNGSFKHLKYFRYLNNHKILIEDLKSYISDSSQQTIKISSRNDY
jgi:hypothetical protein